MLKDATLVECPRCEGPTRIVKTVVDRDRGVRIRTRRCDDCFHEMDKEVVSLDLFPPERGTPYGQSKCPSCGGRLRIYFVRRSPDGNSQRRCRKCPECGYRPPTQIVPLRG